MERAKESGKGPGTAIYGKAGPRRTSLSAALSPAACPGRLCSARGVSVCDVPLEARRALLSRTCQEHDGELASRHRGQPLRLPQAQLVGRGGGRACVRPRALHARSHGAPVRCAQRLEYLGAREEVERAEARLAARAARRALFTRCGSKARSWESSDSRSSGPHSSQLSNTWPWAKVGAGRVSGGARAALSARERAWPALA